MRVRNIFQKHRDVFQEELPSGARLKTPVDHETEVNKESKPPYGILYQLHPVEVKAMRINVENYLEKEAFDKVKLLL